jgi:isopentenyl phosphate kinase
LNRVLSERKSSSISGNDNIFNKLKQTKTDREKLVFGKRAEGVFNDRALKEVEKLIEKRSAELEEVIKSRASNE